MNLVPDYRASSIPQLVCGSDGKAPASAPIVEAADGTAATSAAAQAATTSDAQPASATTKRPSKRTSSSSRKQQPAQSTHDQLAAQRRKAAVASMMVLVDTGAESPEQFTKLAAPMSGAELEQVAEERAISGSCGNPLCGNACTFRPERTVYRPTPNGVVQVPEPARLYCSQRCRVLIQHYADKLGDPMLRLKPEAVKKSMVSHRPRKGPAVAAQGGGVPTMLADIRERDVAQVARDTEAAAEALQMLQHLQSQGQVPGNVVEGYKIREDPHLAAAVAATQQASSAQQAGSSSSSEPAAAAPGAQAIAAAAAAAAAAKPAAPVKSILKKHSSVGGKKAAASFAEPAAAPTAPAGPSPAPPATSSKAAAAAAAAASSPGSDAAGQEPSSAKQDPSEAAMTDTVTEKATDAGADAASEKRGVSFAPDVEYQPVEHRAPQQPVLVFSAENMHAEGDPQAGFETKFGTLSLADSSEVIPAAGNVLVSAAGGSAGAAGAAAVSEEAPSEGAAGAAERGSSGASVPTAPGMLQFWFPPEAGGLGVSLRKASKQHKAGTSSTSNRSNSKSSTAAGSRDSAASTAAPPATSSARSHPATPSPTTPSAASTAPGTSTSEAAGTAAAGTAAAGTAAASPGEASKARKFAPVPRARRGTILLDRPPDVVVSHGSRLASSKDGEQGGAGGSPSTAAAPVQDPAGASHAGTASSTGSAHTSSSRERAAQEAPATANPAADARDTSSSAAAAEAEAEAEAADAASEHDADDLSDHLSDFDSDNLSYADDLSDSELDEDDEIEVNGVRLAKGFFGGPPKGYHQPELSPFTLAWSLLSGWAGWRAAGWLSGMHYEEGSVPVPDPAVLQVRAAMAEMLGKALAALIKPLRIKVPESDISRCLANFARHLRFDGPLPALQQRQWQLITAAVLARLGDFHLPALAETFDPTSGRKELRELLKGWGFTAHQFDVLYELLVPEEEVDGQGVE